MFRVLVLGLWLKVFLFCLRFGVERFRMGLKVLGFGGGFFGLGPCDLAKALVPRVLGLGFRDLGFG